VNITFENTTRIMLDLKHFEGSFKIFDSHFVCIKIGFQEWTRGDASSSPAPNWESGGYIINL